MGVFNKSDNSNSTDQKDGTKDDGSEKASLKSKLSGLIKNIDGLNRTKGTSVLGLTIGGVKYAAGFTPDSAYQPSGKSDNWYGVLLSTHPDYSGNSSYYSFPKSGKVDDLSTEDRFNLSKTFPGPKDIPDPGRWYSTRDYYLMFNDTTTDYFKHGVQVLDFKTPIRSGKNTRESWDGSESGTPQRLANFTYTPYENNDPVYFGFEIIIDAISSPLLNGSVEDFINQFSSISEVAVRKYVIHDFKQQFVKLFKTMGTVRSTDQGQLTTSIPTNNGSNTQGQTNVFQFGKNAYLSYYLKKIAGLENLIESNQPTKKKYLTDYRNDVLKLTFTEDVSGTMATLASLYKLLYWSKPNGKNIVPENLLRFNCSIIISEMRNLNRVRKAIDTGNLEVIKDNVSRHVYSLKECQFYFDQPVHDNEIDVSQQPKEYDQFTVTVDYKYVTHKFERWVPDAKRFGTYAGYNNGSVWKVGNKGSRQGMSASNVMVSVPKFFTNTTSLKQQNGIDNPLVLKNYIYTTSDTEIIQDRIDSNKTVDGTDTKVNSPEEDGESKTGGGTRSKESPSRFDNFKKNSKNAAKQLGKRAESNIESFVKTSKVAGIKLAKSLLSASKNELQGQINVRLRLLNDTLDKIRNANGIGRMRAPTNIYTSHPSHPGIDAEDKLGTLPKYLGGQTTAPSIPGVASPTFFYDVQNSVRDFAGDAIGALLGQKVGNLFRGGNNTGLFG